MPDHRTVNHFEPTRTEALARLRDFAPKAGRAYSEGRNYDLPSEGHPHVSRFSPYIRHRLITEEEVVQAVLARHTPQAVEKYVQEVFWRTYWKGWLELRPAVWDRYRRAVKTQVAAVAKDAAQARALADAEAGATEIDAFNEWAEELVATGYLHNHARMWFASIWIFTLRLPWELGAEFFMRHLLDGDPASNTLSWRSVAGLQTQGKHYLARSSNISKYTQGRHNPEWRLNTQAAPLRGAEPPRPRDLPFCSAARDGVRTAVLLHEDDLSPGFLLGGPSYDVVGLAGLATSSGRAVGPVAEPVRAFAAGAMADTLSRWRARARAVAAPMDGEDAIVAWLAATGAEQVVTPYAPVGPTQSALRSLETRLEAEGIPLFRVRRQWDSAAWPHATKGFFKFKGAIPALLDGCVDKLP